MEATVMDDTSHCFLMSLQCQHVYPAAAVTSKTVMQAWHQWLLLVCVCVCERSWQPGTHANSSFSLHIVIRRLVVNPGPDAYYSSDVITSRQIAVLFVCVYFFTLTHTQMCRCCTVMTPRRKPDSQLLYNESSHTVKQQQNWWWFVDPSWTKWSASKLIWR